MKATLSIALVAALALPVAAEEDAGPEPRPRRFDVSAGFAFLTHGADDYVGDLDSFYVDAGVRRDRFFLFVQYQEGRNAGDLSDPRIRGSLQRVSLNLRHDRAGVYLRSRRTTINVGPFFEVGAGYEWMRWDTNRRASRPDLSFAVGGSARMGRKHHEVGYEIGVRFLTAPGTGRMDGAVDLGGMFFVGIPFSP